MDFFSSRISDISISWTGISDTKAVAAAAISFTVEKPFDSNRSALKKFVKERQFLIDTH